MQNNHSTSTVKELIKYGSEELKNSSPTPLLDTEILLAHSLGNKDRIYINTHQSESISEDISLKYKSFIARRKGNEPTAYIIGSKCFFKDEFLVTPDALIPRPETEELCEMVIKHVLENNVKGEVIDIGTGSGCIILSILKEVFRKNPVIFSQINWIGADLSAKTLTVAKENANRLLTGEQQKNIKFLRSDLLDSIDPTDARCIIANLPYIPTKEIQTLEKDVKEFEPKLALDGGEDGAEIIRKLIGQIKERNITNSAIFLEVHQDNAELIRNYLENVFHSNNFKIVADLSGRKRFVCGMI